jgi:hypothetical protein
LVLGFLISTDHLLADTQSARQLSLRDALRNSDSGDKRCDLIEPFDARKTSWNYTISLTSSLVARPAGHVTFTGLSSARIRISHAREDLRNMGEVRLQTWL